MAKDSKGPALEPVLCSSKDFLAHITLGRQKDPLFINIRNPIPQKV